jgi:unsaturated rhamnogalacturonyl hydrolase
MRNLSIPIILSIMTLISGCNSNVQSEDAQVVLDKAPHTIAVIPYQMPTASEKSLSSALSAKAIEEVADQVANWQLAQFDIRSNKMRPEGRSSGIPAGWMYATFNVGLWHWAQALDSASYYQTAINLSLLNDFQLGPRIYHADDHAIGDVYLSIFDKFGGKHRIENTVAHLNQVVEQPSKVSLEFNKEKETFELQHRTFTDPKCTSRWCWADAVFMSPPVMAHLSKTTGDSKYLDFMDKEFWAMTDYLFDENIQLYLRDSRYFTLKDDQGRLVFWGRGNGWVLAGLARVLEYMPEDYPTRARYLELFKNMSVALLKHQNPDGSWPSSLLEKEKDSHSETSATGLLVFGLAWGINNGVLTDSTYRESVDKAWHSIVENIEPDGRVGFVQQVAFAPGSAKRDDSQLYGSGAVLLAASELYKMLNK